MERFIRFLWGESSLKDILAEITYYILFHTWVVLKQKVFQFICQSVEEIFPIWEHKSVLNCKYLF